MACTCHVSTAWRCRNAGCWKVIEALLWSCLIQIFGPNHLFRGHISEMAHNHWAKPCLQGYWANGNCSLAGLCLLYWDLRFRWSSNPFFLPNRRKLCSNDSPWMCIAWLLIGQDMSFKAFWFESSSILFWLNKPRIQKRLHMFDTGVDGVRLCLHIGLGCGEAIQAVAVDTTRKLYVLYVWNFGTL